MSLRSTAAVRVALATLGVRLATACGGDPSAANANAPIITPKASVNSDAALEAPHGTPALPYPAARRQELSDLHFGVQVADPYRWLEDVNSDETKTWTHAEGELARGYLDKLIGRDSFAKRLAELLYVPSMGLPLKRGKHLFYGRRDPKKEKAVLCVRDLKSASDVDLALKPGQTPPGERVLLDPNTWSADGSISLGVWSPSNDGTKLVYAVKKNNSDEATLDVIDVASGKKLTTDEIPGAKYANPQWNAKGDGFYYIFLPTVDDAGVALKISERPGFAEARFHKIGTAPASDARVHPRTNDPKTFLAANISDDGHWLLMSVQHGWTRVDVSVKDLRKPASEFQVLVAGVDAQYDVAAYHDHFYIKTNDGAPNGRVMKVDPSALDRAKWTELVPERKDASIDSFGLIGGKIVLGYLKDVVSQLEVHGLDGSKEREIPLEKGSVSGLSGETYEKEGFYAFTSFTSPTEIFSFEPATGKRTSIFQADVPFDRNAFAVDQIFSTSADGTKIPMFVIHKKDLAKDGKAPAILYGYGGFQVAQLPTFQSSMIPWLEAGGVYAIANLRGGDEYGEKWHRDGMLHQKQHVFDDAIASAEALLADKWTSKDRLAIRGGSNGGLLVGAMVTQRPDLFAVALCGVPLLDMIRYTEFGSGKTWIDEYGTAEKEEDFKVLLSYSPYHHVKPGVRYPATMMLSSDSDDRVDPMHARKFAALLQNASAGGPVLLRIEKNAGHGGADMMKSAIDRIADEYAFTIANIATIAK